MEKLNEILAKEMFHRKLTLATAESCTGGMLASEFIAVPGISEIFFEGYITYSNASKMKCLHVPYEVLQEFGAVSRQTAAHMAEGAADAAGTDAALAATGIAGPDGGSSDKPVGTVYIACCLHENITVEHYVFTGSRNEIREQAVRAAMELLYRCLMEK